MSREDWRAFCNWARSVRGAVHYHQMRDAGFGQAIFQSRRGLFISYVAGKGWRLNRKWRAHLEKLPE